MSDPANICPLCSIPINTLAYDIQVIQHLISSHKRSMEDANKLLEKHRAGNIGITPKPTENVSQLTIEFFDRHAHTLPIICIDAQGNVYISTL